MRLDPLVKKRFAELHAKVQALLELRQYAFTSDEGKQYFKVHLPAMKEWGTNALSLIGRVFGENSVHYRHLAEEYSGFDGYENELLQARAIFDAARSDYEGGYLFTIAGLAKAEVLSDALEQAKQLLSAGFKDPACVLARVGLETTLKELCARNNLSDGSLERMNVTLSKAGVYNLARQKLVTAWADIGNKAAHGDWATYSIADANAMVAGVEALVAEML